MLNSVAMTAILFRKHSWFVLMTSVMSMAEYVYFLFSFPVENWHFHKRALSRDKPYAQLLRDSYIERFPGTWKANRYQQINDELDAKYTSNLRILSIN